MEINGTRTVLIPKVSNPLHMNQFRLISFCNILYKIISKMLVNRLQSVIHFCIDEIQSPLMLERLILEITLAAFQLLYFLKHKKLGRSGLFALKLDMARLMTGLNGRFKGDACSIRFF